MGVIIAERAGSLDQVAAAIFQFNMMPEDIQNETDQERFSCLQESFVRGIDQMVGLRKRPKMYLEIRVGGITGRVYRVGRSYVANTFDYAQLLIAKRNDITDKVEQQDGHRGIMVHNGAYRNGLPEYKTVLPDRFDIECIQAQMEGALRAIDPRVDDPRVVVYLRRALDGDTFRSIRPKDRLHGVIYGGMNGELNGS